MDWLPFTAIIVTIVVPTIGSVYIFYKLTTARMDKMEIFHREDMKEIKESNKLMDEKWERLFTRMDEKLNSMNDKWERLVLKDQK